MNYNYMEYDQSIEANIKVNYGLKLNKITRQKGKEGLLLKAHASRTTYRQMLGGKCLTAVNPGWQD